MKNSNQSPNIKNDILNNKSTITEKASNNLYANDSNINNDNCTLDNSNGNFKTTRQQSETDENNDDNDEINNKDVINFLSNDLVSQLNIDDKCNDNMEPFNKNFILNNKNDDVDSDQEDMMLIQEENNINEDIAHYEDIYKNNSNIQSTTDDFNGISHLSDGRNYNFSEDETFKQIKKQMNLNKQSIPRIASIPMKLNAQSNPFGNLFSSQMNLAHLNHNISPNNSYHQLSLNNVSYSSSNLQALRMQNNSFTMNGKSGWVCPCCKNFNYEMRIKCNRCGRPQMMYQNNFFGSHENLSQNGFSKFQFNLGQNKNRGSAYDLYFNNYTFNNDNNQNKKIEDKKKKRNFVKRDGDWICSRCQNLNFAFRIFCNRCKLPKDDKCLKLNYNNKVEGNIF